ncbi:AI-2E family transporter [Haladaptatus sp. W1]|uniref:AI-2E family transporter n=1 Tax=Haladaptatus sp. W1 TaxID=1897478 RepID=UPI0020C8264F|nr:AI-2E family transporter [Haladaptatus sp. W1]
MSKILTSTGGYLSAIVVGLLHVFIALAIAFYLLRDGQRLANWFTSHISKSDSATHAFLEAVDTDLQTIYFGNILNAFVVAIIASITYTALNAIAPPGLAYSSNCFVRAINGACKSSSSGWNETRLRSSRSLSSWRRISIRP